MAQIFISYSRSDRPFIDQFIPLVRRVYGHGSVWFDDDIHGGSHWWQMILDEIGKCEIFVYLISNESLESPYCQAELREALRLNKQILPVIVRRLKSPYPGKVDDDLALVLRKTQYIDFSGGFNNLETLAQLYAALRQLLQRAAEQGPQPPTVPQPVTEPPVPDKQRPQRKLDPTTQAALIAGGFALVAAIIAGVFGLWQGVFANNTAPTPTTALAQNAPLSNSETPTLSAFQQLQTAQAQLTHVRQTEAAAYQTATADTMLSANATGTAQALNATEIAAQNTLIALSATSTPEPPTNTPEPPTNTSPLLAGGTEGGVTPDVTETRRVALATLAAVQTATAAAIPTLSPEQVALTPVTRNADWQPVERDFDGVPMVLVPAGQFVMGSTQAEVDAAVAMCQRAAAEGADCPRSWFDDEISDGDNTQIFDRFFWLDKTEVTRAEYQRCVDAGDCEETPASDFSTEPDQPINRVTWFQARAYCEWRGQQVGDGADWRLPTEAEWEYAARGPNRLIFPWGNDEDGTLANHCDRQCGDADWASGYNYVNEENADGYAITAPVGSYPAGASWVGALDMSGNVWEWTLTDYEPYPYDVNDGREDTNRTEVSRVLRGGSFNYPLFNLRAALRNGRNPSFESDGDGFRCVRS